MPAKKPSDESKIMDVSKPGKGKVVGTSRPVVAPVASDTVSEKPATDSNPTVPDVEPVKPLVAPSQAKKVIQPISINVKPDEDSAEDVVQIKTSKTTGDLSPDKEDKLLEEVSALTAELPNSDTPEAEVPSTEPTAPETPSETTASEPESTPEQPKPTEEAAQSPEEDDKAADSEAPSEEKTEAEESDATGEVSDAAGVEALAGSMKSKKEAAQKAEEQAKKDAELQGLIESKKYFVHTSHDGSMKSSKQHNNIWVIPVLILLLLVIGAYVLIDAKIIKLNVTLPYEFFKDEVQASQTTESQTTQATEEAKVEETTEDSSKTAAESKADDTDRKNEIKNLQQKLETYFNDNDEYPASLADIEPTPTTDELTGPDDDAYVYTVSGDNQTYELSATLANKDDKDAENGLYIVYSVNQ